MNPMQRRLILAGFISLLIACPGPTDAEATGTRSIQDEINRIENELAPLPELYPNPTPWTLGYRSRFMKEEDQVITNDLWFTTSAPIDLIALFPATYSPEASTILPFGFPKRFTIERLLKDGTAEVVVDYSRRDYSVTGTEPQLFHLSKPIAADGIRITIIKHPANPTWWGCNYICALSEVMVFSGDWNIALGANVNTSSESAYGYIWSKDCLVDGFGLYSPMRGTLLNPFENFFFRGSQFSMLFDMGDVRTVDELRVWPVEHSVQHNYPHANGIGFPMKIVLEQLDHPDDQSGRVLYQSPEKPPRPGAGPLMLRFASVKGRWFRLQLSNPVKEFRTDRQNRFALAEVELLRKGTVLTANNTPTLLHKGTVFTPTKDVVPAHITDGKTTEGDILPLRTWVEGLNRRAALERRLAALKIDLLFAHRQERECLLFVTILSTCVIAILITLIWLIKLLAHQRWIKIRDRISCDLHDEIGANASSLVQTTELIQETVPQPTAMQAKLFNDAIQTARTTSRETRNFINFLESNKDSFDMHDQIQQVARRMLGTVELHCDFQIKGHFSRLPPARQWDLLMCTKEALNNIIKHADSTRVDIVTRKQEGTLQLIISDNGKGIPSDRLPLKHLEARAKQLNARLTVDTATGTGTRITLNLK